MFLWCFRHEVWSILTYHVYFFNADGLIKKLEELQQNATLYKGKDDLLIFRGRIIVNSWTIKSTLANDATTAIPTTNTTPSPMQWNNIYFLGLFDHTKRYLQSFYQLAQTHKGLCLTFLQFNNSIWYISFSKLKFWYCFRTGWYFQFYWSKGIATKREWSIQYIFYSTQVDIV